MDKMVSNHLKQHHLSHSQNFDLEISILRLYLHLSFSFKQIQNTKGKVLITNDGATILKQMEVIHPTARMVSSLTNYCF